MQCIDIKFESEVNFVSKNEEASLHFITQHLDVKVDNCFAVISMTQVFKNQTDKPIEGEYMFPIETTLKNTAVS
jgi:predicted transposase YdaD